MTHVPPPTARGARLQPQPAVRIREGGVPFTIVIAPGGRVIYQRQGELDIYEFRRAVLANLENDTYAGHPAYWASR
jgi:hypothetical protein